MSDSKNKKIRNWTDIKINLFMIKILFTSWKVKVKGSIITIIKIKNKKNINGLQLK